MGVANQRNRARNRRTERLQGNPSPAKAREILHDGAVHGKALTDRQRRFMGAMAGKARG